MCWRDDIVETRYCTFCGQEYYGELGHIGCPALSKQGIAPQNQAGSKKPEEKLEQGEDRPF